MKKLANSNIIHPESSALIAVDYNEKERLLKITFSNNRTYQYADVPRRVWNNFLKTIAEKNSAGAFINQKIKPFYKFAEII